MSVEIWQATGFDGIFRDSKTKPLILTCEKRNADGKYEEQQFVVKSPGHPEVLEVNLFCEIFGNLLSKEFEIKSPEPAIVAITEDFIEAAQPLLPKGMHLRAGYGVGSVFLAPLTPLPSDFKIPSNLRSQAEAIFAFDLLTSNPDRKRTKANCALQNGNLVAFDFEEAFSFIEAQSGVKPWLVSRLGIGSSHIFARELRHGQTNWTPFIASLKLLDAQRLRELVKDFPPSWLIYSERVFDHIFEAQEHAPQLHMEIEKALRK